MLYFSAIFRRFPRAKGQRSYRASVSLAVGLLSWLHVDQANKRTWAVPETMENAGYRYGDRYAGHEHGGCDPGD